LAHRGFCDHFGWSFASRSERQRPLITMFFLITYAVINLVMPIESSMGLAPP
jgi:hypothetical protein